jgi:ectoine hydroxylase-related dioxygenase (phytanoyl-CoA dioxygenase family)
VVSCDELRDRYERQGFVLVPDAVGPDWVATARAHVERLMAEHPDLRPEHLGHELAKTDPVWLSLVADRRLLDLAECFIGPNIALFATHYICKPPGDGQAVLWHQDGSYWPLEPMEVVTLWVALDDVDTDNGCLRVIPGSHRHALGELRPRTDIPNVLSSELADMAVDERAAVDCILPAGGVEIHHPHIIHGSNPNHSSRWRRGLTIRYMPTSTRITKPHWSTGEHPYCAFLLRGQPVPGVNYYLPLP